MNQEEIIKRLREPFSSKEIEWKIQVTTQDKARGMAVAYLDARAIQKRLDEVVGPFDWKNEYSAWQDKAQICGISIYNTERNEWVTKYDGAENSDIEPIKGGLSDSFKRAACVWGIGRYLYQMDGVWLEVEPKGKSFAIKQNQYSKLESEYNQVVAQIFGTAAPTGSSTVKTQTPTVPPPKAEPPLQPATLPEPNNIPDESISGDYTVRSAKASGKNSLVLELLDAHGEVKTAYVKANDNSIKAGVCLNNVVMEQKSSSYGPYTLINDYKLAA